MDLNNVNEVQPGNPEEKISIIDDDLIDAI
jgi:hypothetical protein